MEENNFSIKKDGAMFLDNIQLRNVKRYELVSSAGSPAELTITMDIRFAKLVLNQSSNYLRSNVADKV